MAMGRPRSLKTMSEPVVKATSRTGRTLSAMPSDASGDSNEKLFQKWARLRLPSGKHLLCAFDVFGELFG